MQRDRMRTILLVDGESAHGHLITAILARAGWRTLAATDGQAALAMAGDPHVQIDAVLLALPARDGIGAPPIAELRALRPEAPVLVMTAHRSLVPAADALRAGAADFLIKPITAERLLAALDAMSGDCAAMGELRPLAEKIPHELAFEEIVGAAPDFRSALAIAAKTARARIPLLLEGESGVGREMLARAIHAASPRAKKPLVIVNCANGSANPIESALFGHEKGAFAGAFDRRLGKFQHADGGTLFLNEVGDLSRDAQVGLLRVLETGEIQPIGARHGRQVDVRVIAATSRRLIDAVKAGRFREDLYYRINLVQVAIPPLRDRGQDVPALARHLLARIARLLGRRDVGITDEALGLLMRYSWPGNVRQLQTCLFRAVALCDGAALTAADFPQIARETGDLHGLAPMLTGESAGVTLFEPNGHLRPLDAIEADVIRLAIGHYRGRMTEVARRLGIGRSTLYRKLGDLGIESAA